MAELNQSKSFDEGKSYRCIRIAGIENGNDITKGQYYKITDVAEDEDNDVTLTLLDNDDSSAEYPSIAFDVNDCLEDKAQAYDTLMLQQKDANTQIQDLLGKKVPDIKDTSVAQGVIGSMNESIEQKSPMGNSDLKISFEDYSEPQQGVLPGIYASKYLTILAVCRTGKDTLGGFVVKSVDQSYRVGQWRNDWIASNLKQIRGKVTLEF